MNTQWHANCNSWYLNVNDCMNWALVNCHPYCCTLLWNSFQRIYCLRLHVGMHPHGCSNTEDHSQNWHCWEYLRHYNHLILITKRNVFVWEFTNRQELSRLSRIVFFIDVNEVINSKVVSGKKSNIANSGHPYTWE